MSSIPLAGLSSEPQTCPRALLTPLLYNLYRCETVVMKTEEGENFYKGRGIKLQEK